MGSTISIYPASPGGSQSRSLQSSPRPQPCFWAEVSPASASFPNVPVNSSAGQSLPQTSPYCLCITQSSPGRESLCNPGWLRVSYVDQLASNPRRSTCLCLPRAGTKGVCHHIQQSFLRQTGWTLLTLKPPGFPQPLWLLFSSCGRVPGAHSCLFRLFR